MFEILNEELNNAVDIIKHVRSVNVNVREDREAVVELGRLYFQHFREKSVDFFIDNEISEYDQLWQDLIRLAHGNNSKSSYLKKLSKLQKVTKDLSVRSIVSAKSAQIPAEENFDDSELVLIETLERIVPSAAACYRQGVRDLSETSVRLSYRGTAAEFREAFRETLDHLAPDDAVAKDDGFKLEPGKSHPTMRQKVRFILKSRGLKESQRKLAERSVNLLENLHSDVARAFYDRASFSAHVSTTRGEVVTIKRYIDVLLHDLLETT